MQGIKGKISMTVQAAHWLSLSLVEIKVKMTKSSSVLMKTSVHLDSDGKERNTYVPQKRKKLKRQYLLILVSGESFNGRDLTSDNNFIRICLDLL